MNDIDPDVNAASAWVKRMILIWTLIGVLILLIGCTYTGRNDPNIQWWDENEISDNYVINYCAVRES